VTKRTRRFDGFVVSADFAGNQIASPPIISCPKCNEPVVRDTTTFTVHCPNRHVTRGFRDESEWTAWIERAEKCVQPEVP
jgi:hypothetical protein